MGKEARRIQSIIAPCDNQVEMLKEAPSIKTTQGKGVKNASTASDTSVSDAASTNEPTLQRGLQNRHIQLIALGGAIGTGLFLGIGPAIQMARPAVAS